MAVNGGAVSLPRPDEPIRWQLTHHFSASCRPAPASPAAAWVDHPSAATANSTAIRGRRPMSDDRSVASIAGCSGVAIGRTPLSKCTGRRVRTVLPKHGTGIDLAQHDLRARGRSARPAPGRKVDGGLRPAIGRMRSVQRMFVVFRHGLAPDFDWIEDLAHGDGRIDPAIWRSTNPFAVTFAGHWQESLDRPVRRLQCSAVRINKA